MVLKPSQRTSASPGTVVSAAALALVLLGGCATPINLDLDRARAEVEAARNTTAVRTLAAPELKDAEEALRRADLAFEDSAPKTEVDHLAYLTTQRVGIADAAAAEAEARQRLDILASERETLIDRSRERDLARAEQRAKEAEEEARPLRQELAALEARETEAGLSVTLGDILFETGRADLTRGGRQQLTRLADALKGHPERRVLIEGHTDSSGSENLNERLSFDRAEAVEDALVGAGVDYRRIVSRGLGERFPIAPNETAAGRQENRRVEILILDPGERVPARV